MIWHHGIPDASVVVLLLLLFITPSGLGKDCFWKHSPLSTTSQPNNIDILKKWMLLDYPVSVPTNLKPDEFCQKIWQLHFIDKELDRMHHVSGKNLSGLIKKVKVITSFVADCKINDNCVRVQQRNVSQFLDSILLLFTELTETFEEENIDYSNCTIVQCQLGPKQAEQKTEVNKSDSSRKHYWWLILLPFALLLVAAVVGTRLQCKQQSRGNLMVYTSTHSPQLCYAVPQADSAKCEIGLSGQRLDSE
ncbi:hypothetical protein lerEdw1_006979 [Lerista edwardsae]|nr:hypothetical protein lerEdw1_006979 [Lerista edwardsae]